MANEEQQETQTTPPRPTAAERMAHARAMKGKPKVITEEQAAKQLSLGQIGKLKKEFRQQFKERFMEKFGSLTQKMLDVAEGYEIMVARDWQYDPKTKEQHRTGEWVRITDPQEVLDLMNGMDEGEEDSYHKISLKDPDTRMLSYIADQLMGKASQNVNLKHDIGLLDILKEIRSKNKGVVAEREAYVVPSQNSGYIKESEGAGSEIEEIGKYKEAGLI